MFVKEAYQKRLKKQQEDTNTLTQLNKSKTPPIGSIKNDKINYERQQQFFSKDDIPQHAQTIKQQVRNFIDPDHLGLRKRQWNSSVSVPKNMQSEETHQQKLLKIKLGFLDHPLPKYQQPIIYDGTDTRNDYTNWNVSNQIINRQLKENLTKTTTAAIENSKLRENLLVKNYLTPFGRTTNFIESKKQQQINQQQFKQQLRQQYIFENPTASEQKINAVVFRLTYQGLVKEKKDQFQAKAMKTDFKATLTQTQVSKIKAVYNHTGVWQKNQNRIGKEKQQIWAWSCCMNQDYNNAGCVQKIKDGNKWNFSSFNNS